MIAILTDPAVGGTFINWSVHYLAGHDEYYSADSDTFKLLPTNPLTDLNSHLFKPNQPTSTETFNKMLGNIASKNTPTFHTMYFHEFNNPISSMQETKKAIEALSAHAKKYIVVSLTGNEILYKCSYKLRLKAVRSFNNPEIILRTDHEKYEDFISYFFPDSKLIWEQSQLTEVWDQREFLALNLRPFDTSRSILSLINQDQQYHCISPMDLWTNFNFSVKDLFEYLELDIDQDRYNSWLPVYHEWKNLHYQRMMFVLYFDRIVESILHNRPLNLSRFNLDIMQEAAIQHTLIYKHNLNLKTWQLEKFVDTQQLYNLLEPNIHPL